ncbi:tetratricopeptide repeat protein [Acidovorax sp. sic0104]|uniref:tetratricopeptide repeat protein n=1 Tax=Acidovorax sp. sic0104 TaxID=2854784 RepID=UPI001C474171|nr:tetratricopeptide repeat protein [Acidovorax sp. sic0104]MBV7541971.1 SEL1-like repeat protein [Acidovorax sp. sic0104]
MYFNANHTPILRARCWVVLLFVFFIEALSAAEAGQAKFLEPAAALLQAGKFEEAYAIYITHARQGNSEAQRVVGEMYFRGQGVPRSYEAAYQWSLRAAAQGDHLAQYSVGYLNETGLGAPQSLSQAQEYYFLSAKQDYGPAQEKLGDIYNATGNKNQAEAWYQKAAINNVPSAGTKYAKLANATRAAAEKSEREYTDEVAREEAIDIARSCSQCRGNEYRLCTEKQIPFWSCNQTAPSFGDALRANLAQDKANLENSRRRIDAITAQALQEPNRQRPALQANRGPADSTSPKDAADAASGRSPARNPPTVATPSSSADADVIETNNYERFPTSETWGDPVPPWMAFKGQGPSRAAACSSATSLREARISEDIARGFVEVKDRTECVCQTTPRQNSTIRLQKGWLCVAYWSLTDLRKRRGDSSR